MIPVKSIIMAGGFGTRLRPLTNNLPKPMVPMANRPMMEHIIELLKKNDITALTALLYFQPEMISGYLGDGSNFGVKIDYITPTVDLGTAGAVGSAMRKIGGDETTLIISGDVLTDIDLRRAVEFHKKNNSVATIVLTRVENPLPFGIVITDEEGRIVRFLEKPSWGEVFSDTINTGIYLLASSGIYARRQTPEAGDPRRRQSPPPPGRRGRGRLTPPAGRASSPRPRPGGPTSSSGVAPRAAGASGPGGPVR